MMSAGTRGTIPEWRGSHPEGVSDGSICSNHSWSANRALSNSYRRWSCRQGTRAIRGFFGQPRGRDLAHETAKGETSQARRTVMVACRSSPSSEPDRWPSGAVTLVTTHVLSPRTNMSPSPKTRAVSHDSVLPPGKKMVIWRGTTPRFRPPWRYGSGVGHGGRKGCSLLRPAYSAPRDRSSFGQTRSSATPSRRGRASSSTSARDRRARRRNELERATRRARPSLGRDPLEQPRARAPVALGGRPIRRPAPSRRARVGDDRGAAAGRRAPARARGTSSEAIARVARRSPRRRSHRGAARRLARRARASLAEADRQASLGHSGSPTGRAVLRSLSHHRGPAALPHSPS